jgi:hypothetical protein
MQNRCSIRELSSITKFPKRKVGGFMVLFVPVQTVLLQLFLHFRIFNKINLFFSAEN